MSTRHEPLTLIDVLADIRAGKAFIAAGMIVALVAAFIFLAVEVPCFKAQMIVGPASPLDESQSVAGRTENTADFTRFENMITGANIAALLQKDERVVKALSAAQWTPSQLADYIRRRVRIEPVGDTRLRKLSYFNPDADFAVYFLESLRKVTDGLIRDQTRGGIEQRTSYLHKTMEGSSDPDQRRDLADLLIKEERLLMLVSIDQPYAAEVVEPAASSYKPKWPDPVLVFAGFLLAGAVAGFVIYGLARR